MVVRLDREDSVVSLTVSEPARDDDAGRYVEALHGIGRATVPFVMLVVITVPLELTHAHRKAQNLWFKAARDRMNRLCRAAAIVRLEPTKEMQRTFQGLWSFPVLVTASREQADAFLALHLRHTPS